MNLKDLLEQLSDSQVRAIAGNLKIAVEKNFVKSYLIRKIITILTSHQSLEKRVLKRLSVRGLTALKQIVFTGRTIYPVVFPELSNFGVIYNEVIPEDLRELLKEYFKDKVLLQLEGIPEDVTTSAFLKLILFLGLIQREQLEVNFESKRHKKRIEKIEGKLFIKDGLIRIRLLFEYLRQQGLVEYENHIIYPRKEAIKNWHQKTELERVIDFYNWLLKMMRLGGLWNFLRSLGETQEGLDVWVDAEILAGQMGSWSSKEKVESLGLACYAIVEGKHYVKLTPEGWFLIKKEFPLSWEKPGIIISADFEFFIHHKFDPFVIAAFDCYGSLKGNDYFIIFTDIVNDKRRSLETWLNFKTFFRLLFEKSRHMPDVVKYELQKQIS